MLRADMEACALASWACVAVTVATHVICMRLSIVSLEQRKEVGEATRNAEAEVLEIQSTQLMSTQALVAD